MLVLHLMWMLCVCDLTLAVSIASLKSLVDDALRDMMVCVLLGYVMSLEIVNVSSGQSSWIFFLL